MNDDQIQTSYMQRMATPPAKRRPGSSRATTTHRRWAWRPWGDEGRGEWTLLPASSTHRVRIAEQDAVTGEIREDAYWDAKGFIRQHDIPTGDIRHDILPDNWRQMMTDHRSQAVMGETQDKAREKWRKKFAATDQPA